MLDNSGEIVAPRVGHPSLVAPRFDEVMKPADAARFADAGRMSAPRRRSGPPPVAAAGVPATVRRVDSSSDVASVSGVSAASSANTASIRGSVPTPIYVSSRAPRAVAAPAFATPPRAPAGPGYRGPTSCASPSITTPLMDATPPGSTSSASSSAGTAAPSCDSSPDIVATSTEQVPLLLTPMMAQSDVGSTVGAPTHPPQNNQSLVTPAPGFASPPPQRSVTTPAVPQDHRVLPNPQRRPPPTVIASVAEDAPQQRRSPPAIQYTAPIRSPAVPADMLPPYSSQARDHGTVHVALPLSDTEAIADRALRSTSVVAASRSPSREPAPVLVAATRTTEDIASPQQRIYGRLGERTPLLPAPLFDQAMDAMRSVSDVSVASDSCRGTPTPSDSSSDVGVIVTVTSESPRRDAAVQAESTQPLSTTATPPPAPVRNDPAVALVDCYQEPDPHATPSPPPTPPPPNDDALTPESDPAAKPEPAASPPQNQVPRARRPSMEVADTRAPHPLQPDGMPAFQPGKGAAIALGRDETHSRMAVIHIEQRARAVLHAGLQRGVDGWAASSSTSLAPPDAEHQPQQPRETHASPARGPQPQLSPQPTSVSASAPSTAPGEPTKQDASLRAAPPRAEDDDRPPRRSPDRPPLDRARVESSEARDRRTVALDEAGSRAEMQGAMVRVLMLAQARQSLGSSP